MIAETRLNGARRDRSLSVILFWTSLLTGVLFWLPFVRGTLEGSDYQWAFSSTIRGRGVHGDYWFIAAGSVLSLVMLFLGRRGAARPFHWLLLAFQLSLTGAVIAAAIVQPDQLVFEGATFGIRVPLAIAGPVVFASFAILSLYWVFTDLRLRRRVVLAPGWTRTSKIRVAIATCLVPFQFVLLRTPLGSWQEMLGIGLIFWQWVLLNRAMNPPPANADS